MLEDDYTYVLRKAMLGHGLAPAQVAAAAGLPENRVLAFSRGEFSPDVARGIAPVLDLNPEALAAHETYHPRALATPGIHRFDLPFGCERVNAWLLRVGDTAFLFDAGHVAEDLLAGLREVPGRFPNAGFITHAHHDHLGALAELRRAGVPFFGAGIPGAASISPGDSIGTDVFKVTACDLSGHAMPALGFHVDGLENPVLVTGDALFAGSIGGCGSPTVYQHALSRLREVLGPLPDETVLLPGHGPASTLGEERKSNPFL